MANSIIESPLAFQTRRRTMTTQLITSGQKKSIPRVAHDAAERALKELSLSKDAAQRVLSRGGELSLRIKAILLDLSFDPNLLQIDRTSAFDPVAFFGAGWLIAEQDERVLALTGVDLNKVTLETMLRHGETSIQGEERLKRLIASGKVRLDAKMFQSLWENRHLIPKSWKSKGCIFFDGTVLRHPGGDRCVLCLYWSDGEWRWDYCWLDPGTVGNLSACLAS